MAAMKATEAMRREGMRAMPAAVVAACPSVPASSVPGCDTGTGGRLVFVMVELADIVRELIAKVRAS